MIITIDGPAGTGKSTVAKKVAEALEFDYLDTGAMYRSITVYLLEKRIDLNDEESVANTLHEVDLKVERKGATLHYFLKDKEITQQIRSIEVTRHVSLVATYPAVRSHLVTMQRKLALDHNLVGEGRDLGSVVFPDATLKIFLTASADERARRRWLELQEKFPEQAAKTNFDKVLDEINERDRNDTTREHSPLVQAKDAILLDTTNLSIEEVVKKLLTCYSKK